MRSVCVCICSLIFSLSLSLSLSLFRLSPRCLFCCFVFWPSLDFVGGVFVGVSVYLSGGVGVR
jgi:hypothetical protein